MEKELSRVIQEIRSNRSLLAVDEASTKAGVVMRLLSVLGWNPFNVEEVKPEYVTGAKRVDYALRISNANKVFIEVKRMSENLDPHQEQLLAYSFQEGVKLAILTNGSTWWFYLPLNEGSWEQRRFYTVDLFEQNPADIAGRFVEFLAKERVKSGDALKSAERVYKSHQKKQILREAIPKAWKKIISEPDDLLVDLLIETAEKICGFRPEIGDVERFLKEDLSDLSTVAPPAPEAHVPPPGLPPPPSSLADDYINKRIDYFVFLGKKHNPRSWQDLLLSVATELYRRHRNHFEKCLVLRGSKMTYFSKNPNELRYPKRIADSQYYVEAKLNSNSIVRRSRDLMSLFGYKEGDLNVVAK
jgi:predicted type IV restriction endonuclease